MADNNNSTTNPTTTSTTNSTTTSTDSAYSNFLGHISTNTIAEMRPITEGFSFNGETRNK
jgi:hypothetical protein